MAAVAPEELTFKRAGGIFGLVTELGPDGQLYIGKPAAHCPDYTGQCEAHVGWRIWFKIFYAAAIITRLGCPRRSHHYVARVSTPQP